MTKIDLDQVRSIIRDTRGPQFMLPARFEHVSFDSYVVDNQYPEHEEALRKIRTLVGRASARRQFWRRGRADAEPGGLYLVGRPGQHHAVDIAHTRAPGERRGHTRDGE